MGTHRVLGDFKRPLLTRCRKRVLEEEKEEEKIVYLLIKWLWTRGRILAEMRVVEDCISCCRGANEWRECGWNAGCRHAVLSISSGNLCGVAFVAGKDRVQLIYFHAYFPCHIAISRHVTSCIFGYNDNLCSNVFCKPNKVSCVLFISGNRMLLLFNILKSEYYVSIRSGVLVLVRYHTSIS